MLSVGDEKMKDEVNQTNSNKRAVIIILYLICIVLGGILAILAERPGVMAYEIVLVVLAVVLLVKKEISGWIWIIIASLFFLATIYYNNKFLYPTLKILDSTHEMPYAQLNIPNQTGHKDMWITPIIRNKTVDISFADEWCKIFFVQFSTQIIDEPVDVGNEHLLKDTTSLYNVGNMALAAYQDLFSAEVIKEMEGKASQLYVDIAGVGRTTKIIVFSDKDFNIYLIAAENFALYCGGDKNNETMD